MTPSNGHRSPLRLLHTSDFHIGNDIYPEDALRGFEMVLNAAQRLDVDAVLVAGDLFDTHRVPPQAVRRVLEDLAGAGRPVVVLPGNHDTVLTNGNGHHHALPGNPTLMRCPEGETVHLGALGLSVWGRPVYDHYPGFRPLEGMAPRPRDGWYVVMAHGMFMDGHVEEYRSSPIMASEVAEALCDYVALGHVHLFRNVSRGTVPAFYCGAPSGPQARSAVLLGLEPGRGASVTPVPLP